MAAVSENKILLFPVVPSDKILTTLLPLLSADLTRMTSLVESPLKVVTPTILTLSKFV